MTGLPDLRIGIVGYGTMGRAHSFGYRAAPTLASLPMRPIVKLISGRDEAAVAAAAASYGAEGWTTDWRELVASADIDMVDICTPPGTHAEIAKAAAAAGKAVLSEKPLGTSYREAHAAWAAVSRAGVRNAIGFNYRRLPAVALMRRMIADGTVGDVRLWRAVWLSDEFTDPATPFDWRFDRAMGGTTIADLGSHMIDMALWMVGPIAEVSAQSETFIRTRPSADGERPVTIDDASSALLRFEGGARGTVEMARLAVRRPCDFSVEVNGTKGTLIFEYPRMNELLYGDAGDDPGLYGMRRIRAEHPSHPYATLAWPIGQGIGYGETFVNQAVDLVRSWSSGAWTPSFANGLAVQAVCDAMELSAAERRWVSIAEITNGPDRSPGIQIETSR
ncbi:MAG: Gfo/Idh/MocA family oxidoreductase [Chloroflexota bacterium]|nr:Gfo/Idh/MocA family oxidoreductase [Chloroflexota bacterium]